MCGSAAAEYPSGVTVVVELVDWTGVGDCSSGKEYARIDQTEEVFVFWACTAEEWRLPGK